MQEDKLKIESLIKACKRGKRASQKELYKLYYSYGMSICLRYSKNRQEAQEILNDGFVKVFKNLDKYDIKLSFKAWLRRILINVAIDYYRKHHKYQHTLEIVHNQHFDESPDALHNLSVEEIMKMVHRLSPAYRMVFNLYVVEGYKHQEIAEQLNITVGASKSNLAKARMKLRAMLEPAYNIKYGGQYGR
ncbi:MAG: RNA polymerase sigma factor [Saprospiraceae bacterium]